MKIIKRLKLIPSLLARLVSMYFTARIFYLQGDTQFTMIGYATLGALIDYYKVNAAVYLIEKRSKTFLLSLTLFIFAVASIFVSSLCTIGNLGYRAAIVESQKVNYQTSDDLTKSLESMYKTEKSMQDNISNINKDAYEVVAREQGKLARYQEKIKLVVEQKNKAQSEGHKAYDMFDAISSVLHIDRELAKNILRLLIAVLLELFCVIIVVFNHADDNIEQVQNVNTEIVLDTKKVEKAKRRPPRDKEIVAIERNNYFKKRISKLLNTNIDIVDMLLTDEGAEGMMWASVGNKLRAAGLYSIANKDKKSCKFNTKDIKEIFDKLRGK